MEKSTTAEGILVGLRSAAILGTIAVLAVGDWRLVRATVFVSIVLALVSLFVQFRRR